MRRVMKWVAGGLAALILLPLVLVAATLLWLNTGSGQRYFAALLGRITAGEVMARDVSGRFPDALRIGTVVLHDAHGTWAEIRDLRLDWSPLRLLHRDLRIELVAADRVTVLRRPIAQPATAPTNAPANGKPSSWYGFRVDVDALNVGHLHVAAPVAGAAASVELHGSAHLASPTEAKAEITVKRLDAPGEYTVRADVAPSRIAAALSAREPAHGLIASIAGLPDLGALSVSATLDGPRSGAAMQLAVAAGPLRAAGRGSIDLDRQAANLDLTANAPAMSPRPDLSWQSVALEAHVHGPYAKPDASAKLRVEDLAASGGTVRLIAADVRGNSGHVDLTARAEGVRVPGPNPELLAAAPLVLTAAVQLDAPGRPLDFTLSHPLVEAKGNAQTAAPLHGRMALRLPDLAPLGAAAKLDLHGSTALEVGFAIAGETRRIDIDGTLGITGGLAPAPALIGDQARIGLGASMTGEDITLSRLSVAGRTLVVSAHGGMESGKAHLDWKVALSDLHALAPTISGRLQAEGRIAGPQNDLSLTADASGEVAAKDVPRGPIKVSVRLNGLPGASAGHVTAEGELDRAPLGLAVDLRRTPDGTTHLAIDRAEWKSAHAEGTLTLANGAILPEGRLVLRVARLADLQPFLGQPVGGALQATGELARDRARLRAELLRSGIPGQAEIARAVLTADIADPTTHPNVDASLTAEGVRAGTISGRARLDVRGPEDRLAVRLDAGLDNVASAPARISSAAEVNATARNITLSALQATWKGATLRLLSPARIDFGADTAVEHLRLGLRQAVLEVNGRVQPALDLKVALSNVTPDLARIVDPGLRASGSLQAEARLTGTLARPVGTARLSTAGLHMLSGPGQALPAVGLLASAQLDGRSARIDARLAAGSLTQLTLGGSAALEASGPLDLHARGAIDLAMLNPILQAQGRSVRGRVTLDTGIGGTRSAPRATGTMQLAGGEVQDYAQGAHLTDMQASLVAAGDTLRLDRFTARAGQGTIGAGGTVGVLAPGIPVDLKLTMNDARPLAGNLLSATLDANMAVKGRVEGRLATSGSIRIRRAEINVPDSMPQSVPALNVHVAGQPPPPPPSPGPNIALDLTLTAPHSIFVRGHGLNAELGGTLHVGGGANNPQPSGAFRLIRGQFSMAGTTLNFTEGAVTFNGVSNVGGSRIDPALHFVATSSSANVIATLTVGGYASDPKLILSSVPQLPQDEILSHLLFGQSVASLSPFQLAEIGAALAEVTGATSGGMGDPLNRLRSTLGLDRLTIGTNPVNPAITPGTAGNTTNTVVQAGRYVAPGVYVGATQGVAGTGQETQANVQIDITRHLKLQTGVGSGPGANNVGLLYQFQY